VPFLPELVRVLEDRGHLALTGQVRGDLLSMSAATADRLLEVYRRKDRTRGIGTTNPGALLKRQVPVRTFTDWTDKRPGFLECDLVAHCGGDIERAFIYTLTLTDVATGWTECLPLRFRTQEGVVNGLERARSLLPFTVLGIDTDNGSEFLNAELVGYCERERITFTRGRAYKKNDQCYVEQKNGAVVRQFVGYDRFTGERTFRQLTEVYRALRLYVNFFQPSLKLRVKQRTGSHVHREFDAAQTPFQRLLASGALDAETRGRMAAVYGALDPVQLLRQVETLQDALWRQAESLTGRESDGVNGGNTALPAIEPVRFEVSAAVAGAGAVTNNVHETQARPRKYMRSPKVRAPRTWRTWPDAFASAWGEAAAWLAGDAERTAQSLLKHLQERHPGSYPDSQLRTLQRRVKEWRARVIVEFDDAWLDDDSFSGAPFLRPLRATESLSDPSESPTT
jgi:hypothetical protein